MAYDGLKKCRQKLEELDKQIQEVEVYIEEALARLHGARCTQCLAKIDDNGDGWLKVDQVSRIMRAQSYMSAIMPTERQLHNRIHTLLKAHGSDPWVRSGVLHHEEKHFTTRRRQPLPLNIGVEEHKMEEEEDPEQVPLPAALQASLQQLEDLNSMDRLEVRVEDVVEDVLIHHALSEKCGLNCPAADDRDNHKGDAESYSPPATLWTLPPPPGPSRYSADKSPTPNLSRVKARVL